MDKTGAARLLRLEILRRQALARVSTLPEGHRQLAAALALAVAALEEEEQHEDRREDHLDPVGL